MVVLNWIWGGMPSTSVSEMRTRASRLMASTESGGTLEMMSACPVSSAETRVAGSGMILNTAVLIFGAPPQ